MKVPKKWIINGKEIEENPLFLPDIAGKEEKEREKSGKPCVFPDFDGFPLFARRKRRIDSLPKRRLCIRKADFLQENPRTEDSSIRGKFSQMQRKIRQMLISP